MAPVPSLIPCMAFASQVWFFPSGIQPLLLHNASNAMNVQVCNNAMHVRKPSLCQAKEIPFRMMTVLVVWQQYTSEVQQFQVCWNYGYSWHWCRSVSQGWVEAACPRHCTIVVFHAWCKKFVGRRLQCDRASCYLRLLQVLMALLHRWRQLTKL